MTLTLGPVLLAAGVTPADALVIRHAYVKVHEDTGLKGIDADSTDDEILTYTRQQSAKPRTFPFVPPQIWVVFIREGGDRARLWSVLENRGETSTDGKLRTFDLVHSEHLVDLRNRLVIGWRSPRTWWLNGPTAAGYPVMEIADAQPVPFPGFDRLVLDHSQLQAVMREHRYASVGQSFARARTESLRLGCSVGAATSLRQSLVCVFHRAVLALTGPSN